MPEEVFLSEQHPISRRWAVLEDDGLSAWLYLTEPDSEKPAADCWIYNRVSSPELAATYLSRGIGPPAALEVIGEGALMNPANSLEFRLVWSADGESVALFFEASLMGFIASGHERGYSRNLKQSSPWGNPLDRTLYGSVFDAS